MRVTDIYGIKVNTWGSYFNFKCWFDARMCQVPGIYINATEGGILGAYDQGNISQIKQMDLEDALAMLHMQDHLKPQCESPGTENKTILY